MTTMTVTHLAAGPMRAQSAMPAAKLLTDRLRLDVSLTVRDGTPTASLVGELDGDSADVLERLIDDLAAQGEAKVVLDLSRLFSVDLAGVAALRDAAALLRECGGWLALASLRPRVRYFLARTGTAAHFATYRFVDDAVRAAGDTPDVSDVPGGTADELRQPVGSTTRPVVPAIVSTLTRR